MKPFVFAASTYFNSAPLLEGMRERDDVVLLDDVPSALVKYIHDGRADACLLPVVDVLGDPELSMIDGLGVCADGAVRSVLLRCRRPLAEVRVVAADPESRTSNRLAQLLLRAHFGSDATVAGSATEPDAVVTIGDRALTAEPGQYPDFDLAETWKKMTGLPFVFAVWAHRNDSPRSDELAGIAAESCRAGECVKDEIAARYSSRLSLPLPVCQDYLGSCVYHRVGDRERRAMREFARLLVDFAVEPIPEPLVEELA